MHTLQSVKDDLCTASGQLQDPFMHTMLSALKEHPCRQMNVGGRHGGADAWLTDQRS